MNAPMGGSSCGMMRRSSNHALPFVLPVTGVPRRHRFAAAGGTNASSETLAQAVVPDTCGCVADVPMRVP